MVQDVGWCRTWGGAGRGLVQDMGWCRTWAGAGHRVVQDMGWCGTGGGAGHGVAGRRTWGGAGHGVAQDMGWRGAGHGVAQTSTERGCQLGHNLLWSVFPGSELLAGMFETSVYRYIATVHGVRQHGMGQLGHDAAARS